MCLFGLGLEHKFFIDMAAEMVNLAGLRQFEGVPVGFFCSTGGRVDWGSEPLQGIRRGVRSPDHFAIAEMAIFWFAP